MKSLFTIYNQRLAGYLMMNGFPLIEISKNKRTSKNDFIFASDMSSYPRRASLLFVEYMPLESLSGWSVTTSQWTFTIEL